MRTIVHIPPHLRPWREWYQLEVWRRRRRAHIRQEPLCRLCLQQGLVAPATIADHIIPHKGDWNKFLTSELQSLCERCHNSTKRLGYDVTIGPDGYPLDPNHPRHIQQQQTNSRKEVLSDRGAVNKKYNTPLAAARLKHA